MTCAACAARIEKVLNRVPGVDAAVNFATEVATVGIRPGDGTAGAVDRGGRRARVTARACAAIRMRERADGQGAQEARISRRCSGISSSPAILTLPLLAQMVPMLASGGWFDAMRRTPNSFRAAGNWCSQRRCNSGSAVASMSARGTRCAAAAPTWTSWWSSARRWRGRSARRSRCSGSNQHVYFEAGAAVITLVLLGKLLEARAKAGTSAALEGLLRLQPKIAHLLRDGATSRRSAGAGRRSAIASSFAPGKAFRSTASCATAHRASTRAC